MYLYDRNDAGDTRVCVCIVGRAATSFEENIARSGDRLTKRCYVSAYRSASRRRACKFIECKRSIVVSLSIIDGSKEDRRYEGFEFARSERKNEVFFFTKFSPSKNLSTDMFLSLFPLSRGFRSKNCGFFFFPLFFFSSKVFAIFHNLTCRGRIY